MLPGIKQFDLTGRAAIVTGGSKGLGFAMAAGLASAGADVVLASRHEEEAVAAVLAVGRAKDSLQRKILAAVMKNFCWKTPAEVVPPEFLKLGKRFC